MSTVEIIMMAFSSVCSVMLAIISVYSVKTLDKITKVELRVAELYIKHDNTEERSRTNKKEIDKQWDESEKIRFRLCSLEGGQGNVIALLESQGKL